MRRRLGSRVRSIKSLRTNLVTYVPGAALALAACAAPTPPAHAPTPTAQAAVAPDTATCGPAVPSLAANEPVFSNYNGTACGDGGLCEDRIDDRMQALRAHIYACLARAVVPVHMRTSFTILEDGSVAGVEVWGGPEPFDGCVCNILANSHFPPSTGRAVVSYPIFDL